MLLKNHLHDVEGKRHFLKENNAFEFNIILFFINIKCYYDNIMRCLNYCNSYRDRVDYKQINTEKRVKS